MDTDNAAQEFSESIMNVLNSYMFQGLLQAVILGTAPGGGHSDAAAEGSTE